MSEPVRVANLSGFYVVIHGLLGDGVAASTRPDPQTKALGKWLCARVVDVPRQLLPQTAERVQ